MRTRGIFIALGLIGLSALGGCVVAGDPYAYDGYGRPYYAQNYYGGYYGAPPAVRRPALLISRLSDASVRPFSLF